jgi:hypothetical protein
VCALERCGAVRVRGAPITAAARSEHKIATDIEAEIMRLRRSLPLEYLMKHGMFASIVKDRVRRAMALAMAAVMEQALASAMEKWKVCDAGCRAAL